jgi:probable rRNA maturation factor
MNFECFVFDEFGISDQQRKSLDIVVKQICETQTIKHILKSKKIKDISFSLILIDNQQAKRLNHQFRNKNTIPDILSFPFNEKEKNKMILGDIVITPSLVKKNYKDSNEGYQKLVIHGLLHLLGFDHIKNSDFKN